MISFQLLSIIVALVAILATTLYTVHPLSVEISSSLFDSFKARLYQIFDAAPSSHTYSDCIDPIPGQLLSAPINLPDPNTRVLVTGAAGFIGSHVASYLSNTLHLKVVAVDDLSGGFLSNLPSGVLFIKGDLKNDTFVSSLFDDYGPFGVVYHLAAYAAEGMSHFIRVFNYRNNLITSVSLLNEAILTNVSTFVFTSSIAAYGHLPTPMHEYDTPHPVDPYGISKYAFELDLIAAADMFNIEYVIFRPHNVYGPHQNIIDKYRNVIGIFLSAIMRGLPLPIFGDGTQTRAFSYIDDVAPAIASSPFIKRATNQIFNVGSDIAYSLLDLARIVSAAMNVSENIIYLDTRKEVLHAQSSHDKIKCYFGLGDSVSLEEGIKRVADWIKTKRDTFVPVEFEEVEVMRNMPPSWITEKIKENQERKLKVKKKNNRATDT